jgi:hypothetical protein
LPAGDVPKLCLASSSIEINNNSSHQPPLLLTSNASRIDQPHQIEAPPISAETLLTMPGLTSASGVLGFLSEKEPELKVFALQTLNDDIDTLWTEVAGSIGQM